ncbi:MAG: ABC transporter ATP-binding protein [Candidatus Thorarchaeota archaeon]|nr:ABC transporter ATP-binding protein [Candidatus Thorarchaeota archaeon]
MVSVAGLVKEFPEVKALDYVDLEVEKGIFGLIGPNGAGKTTLLRILLGLIKADSGTAQVLGLDIAESSLQIRRRIGVLHEKPAYPKSMQVIEYLRKIARIYKSNTSAEELLKNVDLDYAKNREIDNLSAGMYQRLAIAQALIGSPELVFLDEPTSNLDVTGRDDIMSLIVNLHNENDISFFVCSHILSDLQRICHQVAFIDKGKIIEKGNTRDVIEKYTSNTFRIVTSDAVRLIEAVKQIPGVEEPRVSGGSSITFTSESRGIDDIQADIENVADSLDIKLYAVEKAGNLEVAFKELAKSE